ncbi:hypothetical protein ASZ90_010680 [hydrocarbon metagenome]|uniref:Uncharacterized protein n=1 Tax=hydrocarbon metagenome TaxID=938273 RepID=A0A0W8FFB6_9ZZZZ|nr:hypothetical protein [Methanomicrobiaceae archaeon]
MARDLMQRDFLLFKKLAPDYEWAPCPESGHEFRSVLAPVSHHIAVDEEDFAERIGRLSQEDWEYLAEQILKGREELGCMPEEDMEAVLRHIEEEVSGETADRIRRLYHLSTCGVL